MDLEQRVAYLEQRGRFTRILLLILILTFGIWAFMWRTELQHVGGSSFIRYDRLTGNAEWIDITRLKPDE